MATLRLWGGGGLMAVGFLILLLPGPAGWPGIPPFLLGLLLVLTANRGARRAFVQAARQDKILLGPFRRWLRRQAKRRHARRGDPEIV